MSGEALSPGFYDVPAGCVAAVVTHLEMTAPPAPRPVPDLPGATFQKADAPETGWYRDLYAEVGARDWLWFSRLEMPEAALSAILSDRNVEVYTLRRDGRDLALLELDFRVSGACELAFFGVAPDLIGTGAGRVLMSHAIDRAWARPITRFHVHTCTLDHPAALAFYIRSGFIPTRRQVEIAPDPRLSGTLPRDAGPHCPIIG